MRSKDKVLRWEWPAMLKTSKEAGKAGQAAEGIREELRSQVYRDTLPRQCLLHFTLEIWAPVGGYTIVE
jgi:hypothetical protein